MIQTPQPKDSLKAALEECLNKKTEAVLAKLCVLEAISDGERKQVVEDIGKRCVKPYGRVLENNESATEKALKQEGDTVNSAAQLRFRELQWQSKDHPFTNRELIHMISKWIDDTLQGTKSRLKRLMEETRLTAFCKQLSAELRQLSSTCVLANLENANGKINSEVDDALNFFRQQVLKPQIQTCVVNVAAQLRELLELQNHLAKTGLDMPTHIKSIKPPQDFLAPFRSMQFLEKTFIHCLLDRAEFLCSVCDLKDVASRNRNISLRNVPSQFALGDVQGGADVAMHRLDNKDKHRYGSRPSSSNSSASDATRRGVRGHGGHPDDPAPQDMQIVHVHPTDFLMDNMVNQQSQHRKSQIEKERKAQMAAMISIPENLGDFKVLSVEIIDRIFNSLKQMVEEDISDLMRRQRHRDEKWRSIMQPNIVALTNFS